jgi:hypothetical protein
MLPTRPKSLSRFSGRGWARLALCGLHLCACLFRTQAQAPVNVLAWHYDNARTGQNLQETTLSLENVKAASFGKWFSYPVDGFVYAQPLVLTGVQVPGKGTRDLVFVATEHDSVYAFDAENNQGEGANPIWQVSFINPAAGITTVPLSDLGLDEPPELGITGTPVIDPETDILYVVARTKEVTASQTNYVQRLHALDVGTGQEMLGGPVVIEPSVPGFGDGNDGQGHVSFDPLHEFQRPGLVLLNGYVYVAFASAGDIDPYHGWILRYDAHTLELVAAFNDTPNGQRGGIWMSGAAPAVDAAGNLYCMTGNGSFGEDPQGLDFGDSFLKLATSGTNLTVTDYFTPYDQATLAAEDGDLGSGGPLLLPDSVGSALHPHLLVGCGKEGTIYLVDRDDMGHYNPAGDTQIVQTLPGIIRGTWGSPAFFNGWLYIQGAGDSLKAFTVSDGQLSPSPVSQNTNSVWGYPNGTPSVSANGTNNAIVWLIQTDTFYANAPAILHAYNATNLAEELYNSQQVGDRDLPGLAQKFMVPVIANGKVYVGSGGQLTVFGNLEPPSITMQPASQVVAPGASVTLVAMASGPPPLSYQWQTAETNLIGATNATLVLEAVTTAQAGNYSVMVSNAFGSTNTTEAVVVVAEPAKLSITPALEFSLTGTPGASYRVEFADYLATTNNWQPLLDVLMPGDASEPGATQATFNDSSGPSSQRFYRAVAVLP